MKQAFYKILVAVLLCFFFGSCTVHQPMSEMVMFQEKRAYSDSTYFSKYSHSIASANTDHFLESEIIKYTRENYPEVREMNYGNPITLTTNFIFLSEKHKNIGISVSLAPLVMGSGVDATYNVFGKYYLTAAAGMARDFKDYQSQFIFSVESWTEIQSVFHLEL